MRTMLNPDSRSRGARLVAKMQSEKSPEWRLGGRKVIKIARTGAEQTPDRT